MTDRINAIADGNRRVREELAVTSRSAQYGAGRVWSAPFEFIE